MKPYPALLSELLSAELSSLRQKMALTQEAMAEQLRISSRAYSDLELNPHWLVKPSQRLYPEVAYQYNSNLLQVVRSIDGFACASWRENAGLLCSLTCRPLTAAPTSAQFLRILTHCIRSGMV